MIHRLSILRRLSSWLSLEVPDDPAAVQRHAHKLIERLLRVETDAFLYSQVFAAAPAVLDQWRSEILEALARSSSAPTRLERRRRLRALALENSETHNIAKAYRGATEHDQTVLRATVFKHIESADDGIAETTIVVATTEVSMLVLRQLEDSLYPESRGDDYLRLYLDAHDLFISNLVSCTLAKSRKEDVSLIGITLEPAKLVAEECKRRILAGDRYPRPPAEA